MADGFGNPPKGRICRYCGHAGNLRFCTRCGALLDNDPVSPGKYLARRVEALLQPAARFLFTVLPLTIRPRIFFETLNREGRAADGWRILAGGGESASYNRWRRPLSPLAFALAAVVISVSVTSFWWNSPEVQEVVRRWDLGWTSPLANLVVGLFVEGALIPGTICIAYVYGLLLKTGENRHALQFMEYVIYVSTLCWLLVLAFCCAFVAVFPEMNKPVQYRALLLGTGAVASVYCFLIVPVWVADIIGVTKRQALRAYVPLAVAAMLWLVLPPIWIVDRLGIIT